MSKCNCSRREMLLGAVGSTLMLAVPGIVFAGTIHEFSGKVFINGRRVTQASVIKSGDRITTSHDGYISFSIGGDAFMLKEQTSIRVGEAQSVFINTLRLLTGKLLSVFEKGRDREIITSTATIGIRGTACFLNVAPTRIYFCTCYGETVLTTPGMNKSFTANHHNAHELTYEAGKFMGMTAMQVYDHTDDELRQLEAYVGRKPRFDQT